MARPSSESVREATGRDWDEWFDVLDAAGARDWDHKAIVAHLTHEHPHVPGWWQQSITVGYERARGKRRLGQTADATFQVGVTRTLDATPDELWELLVSRPELWLGGPAEIAEGKGYAVPGATGEIRVVKPGTRLRLTWQPDGWPAPATWQLAFRAATNGRTSLVAHAEKLPDAETREAMRERFREALARIAAALGS